MQLLEYIQVAFKASSEITNIWHGRDPGVEDAEIAIDAQIVGESAFPKIPEIRLRLCSVH
jgi:hypothetical protein